MMNQTSSLFVFHAIKENPTGEPAMNDDELVQKYLEEDG